MKHVIPSLLAALLFSAGAFGAGGTTSGAAPKFERLDANKDGAISKDEAQQVEWLDEKFSELDANGDEKLSRAEYSAAASGGTGDSGSGMGGTSPGGTAPGGSGSGGSDGYGGSGSGTK